MHGSLNDKFIKLVQRKGKIDISEINKETSEWLITGDNPPKYLKNMEDDNPLFSRKLSDKEIPSENTCKKFNKYLKYFDGIKYLIMGHTVYDDINTACDGKLIRTDVAISRAWGGTYKENKKDYEVLEIINLDNPEFYVLNNKGKIELN